MADEQLPIPGTVQLIDTNGNVRGRHASGDKNTDIILIPAPSDDPEDPLNWSFRRKLVSTSCVVMYTVMVVLPSTTVYSITVPMMKGTGLSIDDLITGLGVSMLFAGWGAIPLQALALQFGKRPMYVFTSAALIAMNATTPLCTTWGPYLANRIVTGFLSSPVEALCEISITDIWFAHERPRYLAVYGFSLAFAAKIAPTLAGFINYGQSWEWTFYWSGIWMGICFVYLFFFMEETNYDRKARTPTTQSDDSSSSGDNEKVVSTDEVVNLESGSGAHPKKSYFQKLGMWPESRPNRLLRVMWGPMRFFAYPVVVYAGLMYGANGLVWSGVVSATAGTLYPKNYGFSTAGIALAYLGGTVGVVIGAIYCGKFSEWLVIRQARKNGGVSEPEHILWTFLASLIMVPFSLLLWGLGGTYQIHWIGMVISQAALAISNTVAAPIALAYAISAYPEKSGEIVTTTVLIRNTMSFAINYAINPWLRAQGFRDTFITVAAIGFVWNASMFVMMYYGKALRKESAKRYWALVAKEGATH